MCSVPCECAALTWSMKKVRPGVEITCSPPNLGEMPAGLKGVCGCVEPCSGRPLSTAQVQPMDDAPGQVCVLAKWWVGACPSMLHSTELQLCMESEPFTEIEATDGSWCTSSGEL